MEQLRGTVFDIRRFTMCDGPGVRTTIFLKGCPLRCAWCHNPEGRSPFPDTIEIEVKDKEGNSSVVEHTVGIEYDVESLMETILSEKSVMIETGGGVTFSGGEPLKQHQFLLQVLQRCREEGLHTAIDTNGYADKEVFDKVMPFTDLFLFDIKHTNRQKHLDFTAVSTVKIMDNLEYILTAGAKVWIRIPVVPGFNYSKTDIEQMAHTLKQMPPGIEQVHLIPFRQTASEKYRQLGYNNTMGDTPSMKPSQLNPFKRMFRRAGFKTIIGG